MVRPLAVSVLQALQILLRGVVVLAMQSWWAMWPQVSMPAGFWLSNMGSSQQIGQGAFRTSGQQMWFCRSSRAVRELHVAKQ